MRKDRTIGKRGPWVWKGAGYWPPGLLLILALLLTSCAGKPLLTKALTYEAVSAVYNTADVYWHGVRKVWAKAELDGQITPAQHKDFKDKNAIVVSMLAVAKSALDAFVVTDKPVNLTAAYAAIGNLSLLFMDRFLEAQELKLSIETPPSLEMR